MIQSGTAAVKAAERRRARHTLRLNRLETSVRLGCEPRERAVPQPIAVNLAIDFDAPPVACLSDRLPDTVCVAALARAITGVCETREFALVEHLSQRMLASVRGLLPRGAGVRLEVTKLSPPVPGLVEGYTFSIDEVFQ